MSHQNKNHYYRTVIQLWVLMLVLNSPFLSASTETRLHLQQRIEQNIKQNEHSIVADAARDSAKPSSFTINGQQIQVNNNVHELGQAVYFLIQHKQWPAAQNLLSRYVVLENYDVMLVHYAQGAIARSAGRLNEAEQQHLVVLAQQQDFLPSQLELARVLFDNNKNTDALILFEHIAEQLPNDNPKVDGVRHTVNSFIDALNYRQAWRGSFSLGPSFSDNLNQSSQSYTCLLWLPTEECLIERKTPPEISGEGVDFDANISKRFTFSGHHGLSFRGLAYGSNYLNNSEYNEHTVIASLGYSYQTAYEQFSASGQFKYNALGNSTLYSAAGIKLDWLKNLSKKLNIKLELEIEQQSYQPQHYSYQSGTQLANYNTLWYQLNEQWLLFGGLDYSKKNNSEQVHAYQLFSSRFGVNKRWGNGAEATLFASLRARKYEQYSALLAHKRKDLEQNYTLIVSMPSLAVFSMTPVFTLNHITVNSNVDWLYSYDKNTVSLKFEKIF